MNPSKPTPTPQRERLSASAPYPKAFKQDDVSDSTRDAITHALRSENVSSEQDIPDLAEVLAAVNELRAERGMEPLSEMPKGSFSGYDCPVARALGGNCENRSVYATARGVLRFGGFGGGEGVNGGAVLGRFIEAFDNSAYPELVA